MSLPHSIPIFTLITNFNTRFRHLHVPTHIAVYLVALGAYSYDSGTAAGEDCGFFFQVVFLFFFYSPFETFLTHSNRLAMGRACPRIGRASGP